MKNQLSFLSDHDLHEQTLQSAACEKLATLTLLEYLAEVDSRMLYAKRGYSSLWEYVHKALNYSESQSSERVSAMRLMIKVPEVKTAIQEGAMTLTSTLKLATFIKREKIDAKTTIELLKECEQKSTREVEKILLSKATTPEALPFSPYAEKITTISEELTQIQFTADSELLQLIERAKELNAKGLQAGTSLKELIRSALKEYIQKREVKNKIIQSTEDRQLQTTRKIISKVILPKSTPQNNSHSEKASSQSNPASLRAPEVKFRSRAIPQTIKVQIRVRSRDQCEFVDSLTERRCTQRSGLEFDHIQPFAKEGEHSFENLRHYCRTHNRLHAVHSYGKKKMEHYT